MLNREKDVRSQPFLKRVRTFINPQWLRLDQFRCQIYSFHKKKKVCLILHHLTRVNPNQLCGLAHLRCHRKVGTSQLVALPKMFKIHTFLFALFLLSKYFRLLAIPFKQYVLVDEVLVKNYQKREIFQSLQNTDIEVS